MEAPPAMLKAILEWVIAVKAADDSAMLQQSLEEAARSDRERSKLLQEFRSTIMALRSAPTSWKAYKEYYELAWVFGHPGTRWNVRDFQKMTPEKTETLTKRVMARTDDYLTRLDYEARQPDSESLTRADIQKLQPFLRSGVKAGDRTKSFPIDLRGWKYDDKEIERRILDRLQASSRDLLKQLGQMPGDQTQAWVGELKEKLKRQIETGTNPWKTINVVITDKPSMNFNGHWQAMAHTLTLSQPSSLADRHLQSISDTLRHELIHFAQTYLSEMVSGLGDTRAGLPSRKIRTPEYRQQMSPRHPNFNSDSPEVQKVVRQLRQQGLSLHEVDFHSLDDVEFYTKLADSIADFKRRENQVNRGLNAGPMTRKEKNLAIRVFVHAQAKPGTEREEAIQSSFLAPRFFRALQSRAKDKWKKAVSELTKAVL